MITSDPDEHIRKVLFSLMLYSALSGFCHHEIKGLGKATMASNVGYVVALLSARKLKLRRVPRGGSGCPLRSFLVSPNVQRGEAPESKLCHFAVGYISRCAGDYHHRFAGRNIYKPHGTATVNKSRHETWFSRYARCASALNADESVLLRRGLCLG